MFRLTKIKVAGLIAAGAVALGAVGAYAANNGSLTLTGSLTKVQGVTPTNGQTLWALPGTTDKPNATWTSFGECASWYASHKSFVLGGSTAPTTVKKNYHGKVMSNITALCTKTTDASTDSATTDSGTDTGTPPAWAHSGKGRP
ncbi:MAG TPA: hypothetical protein VEQ12_13365 [Candidatus Limnocylindria bacterium]|nr:hypothetical protein [Candidatus Limnocylindria bacterium]